MANSVKKKQKRLKSFIMSLLFFIFCFLFFFFFFFLFYFFYFFIFFFFFFNDTATTEIYTLSLHDALPIFGERHHPQQRIGDTLAGGQHHAQDRKSTRLNSSHPSISYAVFCLKKKKTK